MQCRQVGLHVKWASTREFGTYPTCIKASKIAHAGVSYRARDLIFVVCPEMVYASRIRRVYTFLQAPQSSLLENAMSTNTHVLAHIYYTMGLDARKTVFGVSEQQRHRPALRTREVWSATLLFANRKVPYLNLLHWAEFQFSCWGDWFESHFVRNPKDRFCLVKNHT